MRRPYKINKVLEILIWSLCVLILGIFISTAPTVFGDKNFTSQNGISITYREQKWTENQYCEFPKLSISTDNGSIEFNGNIHYSNRGWK